VAGRIGIARQTLEHWEGLRLSQRLHPCPRGRPPSPLEANLKDQVQDLLEDRRGRLGLPTLKDLYPHVPRTTLKDLRDQYLQAHEPTMEFLTWTRPGAVWSADFTLAPVPIDDRYPFILCARDLASSYHLLAWPVPEATAQIVLQAFRYLFARYPRPLVVKSDNGSPFIAAEVPQLLAAMDVAHLLSPPVTPRYNGGQEASIGSLKTRAQHLAAAAGRFTCWTCDDVEAARLEANSQSRPCGRYGPTPDQLWPPRAPISLPERTAFRQAVARAHEAATLLGPGVPTAPLNATQRATLARRAIRRALVECGYLLTRRTGN